MTAANGETALARVERDVDGLTMVVSPAEALRRVQELQAFVKEVLVRGLDDGVIPGTDKPSLLQPGAQKLEEIYGLTHTFEDAGSIQQWDPPFFVFRKRCVLTLRRDGRYVGDGMGSCNSREDRYAWRWVWEETEHSTATRTTRNGKKQWRVPNPDIFSLVNTIEKMACKRALVHAVIGVTRSSGIFTQDVEDLPKEVFGKADDHRSWEDPDAKDAEIDRVIDNIRASIRDAKDKKTLDAIYRSAQKFKLGDRLLDVVTACADRANELGVARESKPKDAPAPIADVLPPERDYADEGP